jgi:hypothetical protein
MLMRRRTYYDRAMSYASRKRNYDRAYAKVAEFDRKNPNFTGDFDDIPEGEALREARRRLEGYF